MLIQAIFQFPCYFADSGKDIINYANAFKNIDSMHQHSKASLSPQQSCQSVVSWFKLMGLSYYLRVLLCKLFVEYCLSIVLITLKKMLCCSLSLVDFRNVSSIMFHVYQTKSEKIDRLLARGKSRIANFLTGRWGIEGIQRIPWKIGFNEIGYTSNLDSFTSKRPNDTPSSVTILARIEKPVASKK